MSTNTSIDNTYAKAMQSGSKRCNNHQVWTSFSFPLISPHFPSFSLISPHSSSFFLISPHFPSFSPFIPFFRGLLDTGILRICILPRHV